MGQIIPPPAAASALIPGLTPFAAFWDASSTSTQYTYKCSVVRNAIGNWTVTIAGGLTLVVANVTNDDGLVFRDGWAVTQTPGGSSFGQNAFPVATFYSNAGVATAYDSSWSLFGFAN